MARDPANRQIAAWVAALLGDGDGGGAPAPDEDSPLRRLVEQVTLVPWQLGDASFAPLRASGYDDAALFAVCAAASSFGVFSRLRVALIALAG